MSKFLSELLTVVFCPFPVLSVKCKVVKGAKNPFVEKTKRGDKHE